MKKTYTLFWLTGDTQLVEGEDVSSAMNNAGIGAGALRALDFYSEGDQRHDYFWNNNTRNWHKTQLFKHQTKPYSNELKSFMNKDIDLENLILNLKELEIEHKVFVDDDIEDGRSIWFRFSPGDSLVTTIEDLRKHLNRNKTTASNYGFTLEQIELAIKNDSLEVYYS